MDEGGWKWIEGDRGGGGERQMEMEVNEGGGG